MGELNKIKVVLDSAVNEAVRILDANAAYIRLIADEGLVPGAATASAVQYLEDISGLSTSALLNAGKTIAGQLIATKKPVVLNDITESDLILSKTRLMAKKHGFHGTVGVPLLKQGEPVGVFFVFDRAVRRFTEDEISNLVGLANQTILAVGDIA